MVTEFQYIFATYFYREEFTGLQALFGKSENILDGDSDLGNMGVLTLDGADGFGGSHDADGVDIG